MKKWIGLAAFILLIAAAAGGYFWLQQLQESKQNELQQEELVDVQLNESGGEADELNLTRTDEQSEVAVDVTLLSSLPGDKANLRFGVGFNTHSVDLSDFDVVNSVILHNDKGQKITEGFNWREDEGSGHHRSGELSVSLPEDSNFLNKDVQKITLTIKDLDGVPERAFSWDRQALDKIR